MTMIGKQGCEERRRAQQAGVEALGASGALNELYAQIDAGVGALPELAERVVPEDCCDQCRRCRFGDPQGPGWHVHPDVGPEGLQVAGRA